MVDGRAVSVRAELKEEWPNSTPQTMMGLLYAMLVQLDRELSTDQLARPAD